MAVYKVPQDVEAEDKLVGPFGFRQFAYLMIAGFCIFLAYLFFRIYPALALLPVPVIGLFTLIALPLRKDQPMEIYLLALLRFYLKPKRRLWNPDGTITYIEITVPKSTEEELPTKGLSHEAAEQRLDYLARVMDSRGWSIKGVVSQNANTNVTPTVAAESFGVTDIMDAGADVARTFDDLLAKKNAENRQNAIERMRQQDAAPTTAPAAAQPARPRFARNPYDDVLARQFSASPASPGAPAVSSFPDANSPQPQPQSPAQPAVPSTQAPPATPQLGAPWLNVSDQPDEPTVGAHGTLPGQPGTLTPGAPVDDAADTASIAPKFSPYPTAIHQKVIDPTGRAGRSRRTNQTSDANAGLAALAQAGSAPAATQTPGQNPAQKPMTQPVSPDIIRLASNPDLSISAMAHEARRITQSEEVKDEGEVFIKLH